jgi:flagellar motor switch protein FliN
MSDRDSKRSSNTNNDFLNDIPVDVVIELGRKTLLIREVKELKENEVVTLDQTVDDPLDIRVGDKLIARGELVMVNNRVGLRITEMMPKNHS